MGNSSTGGFSPGCDDAVGRGVVLIPTDCDNLALCAILTVLMQLSFYFVACSCKFDKVTDFAGGSNFVLLAVLTFGFSGAYNARQIVITVLMILWGVRLAGYLLIRILKTGKDDRFDKVRQNPLKFLVFWIFQIVWVFVTSLGVIFINSPSTERPNNEDLNLKDITVIVGALMVLFGLVLETVADQMKFNFRNNPSNKGKFCNVGPWKYSRHPNYLGEIVVWWGVFVASTSILTTWKWVAILSPLFVTFILVFTTGMPPLERGSDQRYGGDKSYWDYKAATSPLILLPPYLYKRLNKIVKAIFCCEFPFYTVKYRETRVDKTTGNENETTPISP